LIEWGHKHEVISKEDRISTSMTLAYNRFDGRRIFWKMFSLTFSGAAALGASALVGAWILYLRPVDQPRFAKANEAVPIRTIALRTARAETARFNIYGSLFDDIAPAAKQTAQAERVDLTIYGTLFDPTPTAGSKVASLAESAPLRAGFEPPHPAATAVAAEDEIKTGSVEAETKVAMLEPSTDAAPDIPTPAPRPAELVPPHPPELASPSHGLTQLRGHQPAQHDKTEVATATPSDTRSFVEKFFGMTQQQPSGPVLAYAPSDSGLFNLPHVGPSASAVAPSSGYDQQHTAIYDISHHTVYLPNGTRLEAHSGLGSWMDDPRHVNEKMRGATPPSVYELEPRGSLFHGVAALRLKPISGNVYGRAGLLAHTYMLGPNGQSNGCVSFRNYAAFLRAYQNGEIKRLAVVASLN
jgi:hypothetical protein